MDRNYVEYTLRLGVRFNRDTYTDSVVELLTPPKWYRPIRRYRYFKTLPDRITIILAEYAKELIEQCVY